MAWIPLLLASWIVVDVVIVAAVLAVARRKRRRDRAPAPPLIELRMLSRGDGTGRRPVPVRTMLPLR